MLSIFDDGSGAVEMGEMRRMMFNFMEVEEIQEMFANMNVDGHGQFDVSQFVKSLTKED